MSDLIIITTGNIVIGCKLNFTVVIELVNSLTRDGVFGGQEYFLYAFRETTEIDRRKICSVGPDKHSFSSHSRICLY